MYHKGIRPRVRGLWAFGFALAAVCGGAVQGFAAGKGGADPKLLLIPIVVHSAEDPEYLRSGLADMLAARFARIGALELVLLDEPGRGTTDLAQALELGRKAGADYVLFGSFTRFGQGASLDVQCSSTD